MLPVADRVWREKKENSEQTDKLTDQEQHGLLPCFSNSNHKNLIVDLT